MSFNVQALQTYVDQVSSELMGKLYWKGDSLKYFKKMAGVTGTIAINYFDIVPYIHTGDWCNTILDSGTTTFYQKDITVCDYKTEGLWCVNTLQKQWLGWYMKGVAGDSTEPFEKQLIDQLIAKTLEGVEDKVWMGTDNSCTLGLYYQLSADTARTATGTTSITISNVISQIMLLLRNLPAELQNDDELYMFVAPQVYTLFQQAMFQNNNYGVPLLNYDANGDIIINWLGPKFILHQTFGLRGTNYMFLTTLKNLFHAFDGTSDEEKVDVWYERIYDQICYRIKWRQGQTYWLGDYFITNF